MAEPTMTNTCDANMADMQFEVQLRQDWRDLVERRLPQAWIPGWPVRFDHCFARILLDTANGRPWRENISPPAWKNTPVATLERAIATGESVLAGEVDLAELNRESLRLRGKL